MDTIHVFESSQSHKIKMATAGVANTVPRFRKDVCQGRDSFAYTANASLIDIAEAICIASDWEFFRFVEESTYSHDCA